MSSLTSRYLRVASIPSRKYSKGGGRPSKKKRRHGRIYLTKPVYLTEGYKAPKSETFTIPIHHASGLFSAPKEFDKQPKAEYWRLERDDVFSVYLKDLVSGRNLYSSGSLGPDARHMTKSTFFHRQRLKFLFSSSSFFFERGSQTIIGHFIIVTNMFVQRYTNPQHSQVVPPSRQRLLTATSIEQDSSYPLERMKANLFNCCQRSGSHGN